LPPQPLRLASANFVRYPVGASKSPFNSSTPHASAGHLIPANSHSSLATIPFRITSLPRHLTPIESHSYKNHGEGVGGTDSLSRVCSTSSVTHSNGPNRLPLIGLLHRSLYTPGCTPSSNTQDLSSFSTSPVSVSVDDYFHLFRPRFQIRGQKITVRVMTPCAGCTTRPPMSPDPDGPVINTE
jgi:hypothetical protein